MAKLNFKKENAYFELEVGDEIYTGILNDLTKAQKSKQDKLLKPIREKNQEIAKNFSKIERLQTKLKTKRLLEEWGEVDRLETEIFSLQDELDTATEWVKENYHPETMFKDRLNTSVESGDLEDILRAGEEHGYENVFNTIILDITQREADKKKESSPTLDS